MAKAEESSVFVSVGCSLDKLAQHQEKKGHIKQNTGRCLVAEKNFVSAFFCSALYFLDVHVLRYFPLLLNLHLVPLLVSFCF